MNFKLGAPGAYLVLTIWLVGAGSLESALAVERESFMLVAQVSVKRPAGTMAYYDAEEFHSSWQVRSRVNYEVGGPGPSHLLGRRGTIYATANEAFVLESDKVGCTRADHRQVNEALGLHFLAEQTLDAAVGTARLLLFVGRHSSRFVPAPANTSGEIKSFYQAHLDNELTLTLIYDEAGLSLPLGVPQQVLVERGPKFKMLVKFVRVARLEAPLGELILSESSAPSVRQAHMSGGGGGDGNHLLFDLFAIERARGCSIERQRDANASRAGDFLQALAGRVGRFSFEARLKADKLARPLCVRVGYEPTLRSLRVERLMASRVTITLVNYDENKIFHVIRRRAASDTVLDKILKVNQNERLHNDRSCVVLPATPPQIGSAKVHTLGEMLLGVADTPTNVTYLGLARVRGFEAHAYEAHGTQLPAWLEQPSVYREGPQPQKGGGATGWRARNTAGSATGQSKLTSVFYFSRSTLSDRLLLIEVFAKISGKNSGSRPLLSMPIYDFTWQLRTTAPGGQRVEDFFSLGDECLAGARGENHHARVNLELKRTRPVAPQSSQVSPTAGWLRLPARRNLALLRALHEQFVVASTLVYDLESKYDESNASITASMLTTAHLQQPIQLVYLGQALLRRLVAAQFHPFWALSFQVCYLVASHKQEDTLFAYNPVDSNCYTLRTRIVRDEPAEIYFYFGESTDFLLETYKIVHPHDDRTQPTNMGSLGKRLQRFGHNVILRDPDRESPHLYAHPVAGVQYAVAHSEVNNNPNGVAASDTPGQHLFRGLGLVAGDSPANELVLPKWISEATCSPRNGSRTTTCRPLAMSFVQCQEACLFSTHCRAFSICLVRGQLECVLTSGDFRAPELLAKLVRLRAAKRVKMGQVFQVNASVSSGSWATTRAEAVVRLRRHPTCELHNKDYSGLFSGEQRGGPRLINLRDYRLLTPVARRESCAELCFRTTMAAMQRLGKKAHSATDPSHAHLCSGYFHLDQQVIEKAKLTISPEQVRGAGLAERFSTTGYCLLDSDLAAPMNAGAGKVAQLVVVHPRFEFDYRIFYETNYGRYLVESRKTQAERDAYAKIMSGRDDNGQSAGESSAIMKAFVERGGNTGRWVHASRAAECAQLCFTQAALVWPACRSFEFIEVNLGNATGSSSFCAFNSVTMGELLAHGRADLIWRDGGQQPIRMGPAGVDLRDEFRVWHFEPSPSLLAHLDDEPNLRELIKVETHRPSSWNFKTIGFFVTIYLVAMVGFVAGVRMGSSRLTLNELLSRLRVARGLRGDRDRARLVREQATAGTEFDDIAPAERTEPS